MKEKLRKKTEKDERQRGRERERRIHRLKELGERSDKRDCDIIISVRI